MSALHRTLQLLYEHYRSGAYFKAEVGIREALEKWPNDVDVLRLGALTALEINQIVTAHQRIDKAIERAPMTAEVANIQGRILKASGDWAAAEEAYDVALKLDPKFERAKLNRLNLFTLSEQPKRVLEALDEHTDFGSVGELARAQALTELGRYEEALDVLRELNEPRYQDQLLFLQLKCCSALGRLKEMSDIFSSLSVDSPLYPKALTVVVNAYEMRGQRDESLEQLEKSIKPSNPSVGLQTTRLYKKLDAADRGKAALEALVEKYPANIDVLCEAANAARVDGKADESCDIYTRALKLSPGHYEALTGFAQAAIVAGRLADAQTVLQAALNQTPNNQFLLALVATVMRQSGGPYQRLYDYSRFVRAYDIVPPKGYETVQDFNRALKEKLNELHVYKHAPINQSLRQGTQTELDLSLIDDSILSGFFDAVDAPIRDYVKSIGFDAAHPLRRRNRGNYRVQGAWSVRLQETGHHVNHVHPMGWLSSAYYVDLPKQMSETSKQGWIKFGEPNLDVDQPAEHYVQPKAGRLVLFPSYMWHGTVPFTGPDTRLTLPFDVVPA